MFVVVKQDINITDNLLGLSLILKADTEIYLDLDENVAFWNGIHFDINPDEYNVLN